MLPHAGPTRLRHLQAPSFSAEFMTCLPMNAEAAVFWYRADLDPLVSATAAERRLAIRAALRGADLACWCRLDHACHADILLEIANG